MSGTFVVNPGFELLERLERFERLERAERGYLY
jgi:hypothetical protein